MSKKEIGKSGINIICFVIAFIVWAIFMCILLKTQIIQYLLIWLFMGITAT